MSFLGSSNSKIISRFRGRRLEKLTLRCGKFFRVGPIIMKKVGSKCIATAAITDDGVVKYNVVALGGTFDRFHSAHKILLEEAVRRCSSQIIVGVTDEAMTQRKRLADLIQPLETRIANVSNYLEEIAPSISRRVEPISDPYGPTILEPDIQLIVVSEETRKGADKINQIRTEKNFPPLIIHSIPVIDDLNRESEHEESKISSSSLRLRLLGQRLQPPFKPPSLPYIIGLTGGIASGKSSISRYLENVHKIPTIDCDKLGHEAYKSGTLCFEQIISTFGSDIQSPEGEIDRKALGAKVFKNPNELKKLTDIVWPEIRRLRELRIDELRRSGAKIILIDAAVMLEAGWDGSCHELWITFVPRDEALRRIQERDNLSLELATQRIDSQMSNRQRLQKATFAFSSLWETTFTQMQVAKALVEIQALIKDL